MPREYGAYVTARRRLRRWQQERDWERIWQSMARDFLYEVWFLGMEASPAFVSEPQGNGIAERAIGLVKEQAIWGHHFQTLEDAKKVIGGFIARYNADWLIERLKFRSPIEARQAERALS